MFDTLQPSFRLILGAVVSLLLWQGHSPGYGQEPQESVAEQPQAEPEPNQEPAQEPAAESPPEPLEFEPPAPEAEPPAPEPAQEPAAEHLPEPPVSEPPAEQPPEPLEFEPPEHAEPAESEPEQTAEPPAAPEPAQEPAAEQPPELPASEQTAEPAAESPPEPLEFEPPESESAQEPPAEQSPEPPEFEQTAEPPPEPPASEPPPEPLEFEPAEPEAEPAESEPEHTAEPPPDQAEAASESEQVVTRAWVHDDFGRIVFDWPGDVGYTASIADKTLTVVFDHRLETTFEQVWSHLGAYITDIALGPDGRTVMAALTDDYRLRTFPLHQGEITKIVLDVLAGPEPDQPTAAQAEAQLASAAAEQPPDRPLSDPLPEEEEEQPAAPTAAAQPPPDPSPAHTTPAAAEQPPEPPLLTLSLGHSRIIRLETPAASVFIGNPALADVNLVSSSVLHLLGKAIGRTSLAALDQAGALIAEWTVATVVDVGPVRSALEGAPALKDMGVRHLNKGVELSGVVASAAQADLAMRLAVAALPEEVPVTNHIRVAGAQQVNLEVQIAEMQRSVSESLGINWEAVDANGTRIAGFRIGRDFINETTNQFIRAILPGGTAAAAVGQQLIGTTQVRVLLDALATAGLVSVLARPSLTAVSGETASFFSGGEFPLPAGFDDGVIAFSYKKFGVLLDFVPTVVDSGRIVLTVRSEVSQRSATDSITVTGLDIPVIDGRRAETTVEVGNGESIVIAGLYRDQSETTESGMPFLKDIPLVNLLFSSRTARSNATELIVVVTARLTDATSIPLAENREQPSAGRRLRGYYY